MAKFSNLICAEKTDTSSGDIVIEKPVTTIIMDILPNNYSFFVSFSIVDIQGELTNESYINVSLTPEGEEPIATIEMGMPRPYDSENDEIVDSLTGNLMLNNVKFNSPGLYTLTISSDLCESASTYFSVRVK
ncbi:hypothetical protein [Enterococcus faecalis]|uniref:hypothetical protein n=1 Tax=Enterococcus faecalis TaxID=1351 RepID=UPI001D09D8B4|nr:hypothetical protein [Enterococcus faecalis]MCB8503836.1 hypothetical protein [Enterococcus faecalis]MCB8514028.1 hypothetical protein [Enterococcus faecalis]